MIYGNAVGGTAPIKTLKIVDEDGAEFVGVVVDNEVIFTANAEEDIREGKVAATNAGIVTGSAVVPNYHTTEAVDIILPGEPLSMILSGHDLYDYTKLQVLICLFNTSLSNSVSVQKTVINDNVYIPGSVDSVSEVIKNSSLKSIDLGITNDTDAPIILRYFTYKEMY